MKRNGFAWSLPSERNEDMRRLAALEEFVAGFGYEINDWQNNGFIEDMPSGDGYRLAPVASLQATARNYIKVHLAADTFTKNGLQWLTKAVSGVVSHWCDNYIATRGIGGAIERFDIAHGNFTNASRNANNAAAEMAKFQRIIDGKTKFKAPFGIDELEALFKEGFYSFHKINSSTLFLTTSDVHLSEVKRSAKLELRANLGKFQVALNACDGSICVSAFQGNISVDGLYHPHIRVSEWGGVCFGSGLTEYQRLTQNADLIGVLRLLQLVFHSYNAGSCYVGLDKLVKAIRAKADAALAMTGAPAPQVADSNRPPEAPPPESYILGTDFYRQGLNPNTNTFEEERRTIEQEIVEREQRRRAERDALTRTADGVTYEVTMHSRGAMQAAEASTLQEPERARGARRDLPVPPVPPQAAEPSWAGFQGLQMETIFPDETNDSPDEDGGGVAT